MTIYVYMTIYIYIHTYTYVYIYICDYVCIDMKNIFMNIGHMYM